MSKSTMAFHPAPRPQPRTTPEETERLKVATQDLGFARSVAPEKTSGTSAPNPSHAIAGAEVRKGPALKIDVPDALWDELRIEAVRRRVTVKYLALEALAAKGYTVDLSTIPEDGRRIR